MINMLPRETATLEDDLLQPVERLDGLHQQVDERQKVRVQGIGAVEITQPLA
jgi:hypothetical protein